MIEEFKLCKDCGRKIAYKDGTPMEGDFCTDVCEWHYNVPQEQKDKIKEMLKKIKEEDNRESRF